MTSWTPDSSRSCPAELPGRVGATEDHQSGTVTTQLLLVTIQLLSVTANLLEYDIQCRNSLKYVYSQG